MLNIYYSSRVEDGVPKGYVSIWEDGIPLESFHTWDKTGEATEKETAIAAFEDAAKWLASSGYFGCPISIVSKYSEYGYAILTSSELLNEEVKTDG
ncbi:hypothetical protein [Brevibacillus laterosporus]|uniref:Uncharacterized protein n=1 Tax=Brevibacillus laterosporus TaxID=1465 RepID=A0AAP3DKN4_BRELA|nr:hypothetical protein [Brevibacillus laterosporus]MCR8982910.1 hypothetical protein [Brevibacillus laterosporus]MCZ0810066.1 hypothetical protein [Brevibacillus laterosporus]MCZ0828670.1 hypothetical protein [Brevibacillus laterosporus]MCZ0853062.1 hypothetical protein [Brevibacillus laterosporus]